MGKEAPCGGVLYICFIYERVQGFNFDSSFFILSTVQTYIYDHIVKK